LAKWFWGAGGGAPRYDSAASDTSVKLTPLPLRAADESVAVLVVPTVAPVTKIELIVC